MPATVIESDWTLADLVVSERNVVHRPTCKVVHPHLWWHVDPSRVYVPRLLWCEHCAPDKLPLIDARYNGGQS